MRIICDVDEVLNDFGSKLLSLYNSRTGSELVYEDLKAYDFHECFSQDVADGLCELFTEKELWDSLKPAPGSQKGLKTLVNSGHDIYLATATVPINFSWKVDWLEEFFPFIPSDNIIRIINKGLLNCDLMIDDHILNLTSNICNRIILDKPWNRNSTKDHVYDLRRAYSWNDIVKLVNEIEKEEQKWQI